MESTGATAGSSGGLKISDPFVIVVIVCGAVALLILIFILIFSIRLCLRRADTAKEIGKAISDLEEQLISLDRKRKYSNKGRQGSNQK